jgi:hypothetical protein
VIYIPQPPEVDPETGELTAAGAQQLIDITEGRALFQAAKEQAEKQAEQVEQDKHDSLERRKQLARDKIRREKEEADIAGTLSPDAEMFRDLRLRPRVSEVHEYEAAIRTPIVQGLFFKNSLAWVAGTSGTFKSFVTADLAFRYGAADMDYHGKKMTHGRVLLVIAEGAAGYADRKTAWEKHHQREIKDVSIFPAPLQLGDTLKEMPALISYLREEAEGGNPFDLVIFDTQAMCTVGVDENTSEMNLVMNMLHRIREVNGACVMVVHHFGKNEKSGMRGSSMIYAAADTVCILKKKDDETTVKLSTAQADGGKQKDAISEKDLIEFDMESHPVGEDYFGEPVFSLVPVSIEGAGREFTAAETEMAERLPDVTELQMFYLRAIGTYEEDGALPSYLRDRITSPEYEDAPPEGHRITRTSPGNQMQELKKRGLTAAVPGRKGAWRITPLGVGVIAREIADRVRIEDSWTSRSKIRRAVHGAVHGQGELEE